MSNRKVQLVILCEDQQQAVFARHFFIERGVHPRKIRINKNPKGKGSGEQYVRGQYLKEVKGYRRRSAYQAVALAIIIDADTLTVDDRLKQLNQTLEDNLEASRTVKEKIAIFVPKRNIETWIHYLRDVIVDENTVYPKLNRPGDCKADVKKLTTELCPVGLPENAPPSLIVACEEVERVL